MEKKLIQSVLRAVKILDIVSEKKEGIGLKEISDKLGLGSSTVFYLINTLVYADFIIQINNKFKLGPKNLKLGNNYLENLSIYNSALPILENLLVKINENIYLFMNANNEFLQLAKLESTHSVKPTRVDTNKSNANATAIGKILISDLSNDKLKEFFNNKSILNKYTDKTITSFDLFCEELEKIKRDGYALDCEESESGVNCSAAPVYNHEGKIKAAIGISIPTQRFSEKLLIKIIPLIKQIALEISSKLGFRN